ncbi:MAG: decaprenyl-phosphate phosphoribosyltransferase [Thermomicrobiales bacterium]
MRGRFLDFARHDGVGNRSRADTGGKAAALARALRPLQWTKNGLVFAALVFDQHVFEAARLIESIVAALVFCAVSSGVYLVNDVRDAEHDRLHPRKRRRPVASGEITTREALTVAAGLFAAGMVASWLVRPAFTGIILGYVALMIAYSYGLKRLVILDVFAIAAGFMLRAAGGAVAIAVPISPWLYVCTMLLALFVGFGKRRHELALLEETAGQHRANLDLYSLSMLDQIIGVVAAATVMAYSLYTFDSPAVPDNHAMMLTIPFVVYAIFRYLYLIHKHELGGSPEALLFADRPLLLCIVGWGLASLVILYVS